MWQVSELKPPSPSLQRVAGRSPFFGRHLRVRLIRPVHRNRTTIRAKQGVDLAPVIFSATRVINSSASCATSQQLSGNNSSAISPLPSSARWSPSSPPKCNVLYRR